MSVYSAYEYVFYELSDPRVKNNIFFYRPWGMLAVILSYWYFVKVCGPKFMKNRKPYKIDRLVQIYNIIQITWNLYMITSFVNYLIHEWRTEKDFDFFCLEMEYSDERRAPRLMYAGSLLYTYNKFFDLTETIFFILRKKFNQVTYLHLFHHIGMCIGLWLATRFSPGGNPSMVAIVNSGVHVLMYVYYQLSSMGLKKWIWWKKYLTQIQLMQFVSLLIYNLIPVFKANCYYNAFGTYLATVQAIYFIYLFSLFYVRAYTTNSKKKT